ncbi:MDR family MFS transporter [Benzoatithermus flavus]|uniref:MDR family MFS transporter n=1 Tax=Benzoatithermus flavus TaxID=3108223 RepID=A0ABU8XPV4_9PROT
MRSGIPAPPAAASLDHAAIRSIMLGIMLAMFLGALDQTIVATALPTIGRELGDVEHLPWVVTAYLLSSTAVTPLYGKLSDIHGRRRMMLVSVATFVVGSIACAVAPSMLILIVARGLQGLGGGGLISLAQTIIADILAPKERARYQAYIAAVFVTSSVAGPVMGGFFAEHLHWSMIFWINLPLGLGAYWMTDRTLRRLPRHERPHRLDLAGAVLIVLATVAFMLALNWGGVRFSWNSAPILGLLAATAILAVLFALRLLTAAEPFLPLSVLFNPVVARGTAAACFGMGTFIGLSIFVPVYFELLLGLEASRSGLALIPLMGGVVTGATLSGRLMTSLRHYKRPAMAGLALAVLCLAFLAWRPDGLRLALVELLLGIIGVGIGTLLPVTTVSIQNAVPMHQLGTATGAMNFFRSLGSAVAVAAFGAIVLGGIVAPGASLESLQQSALPAGMDLGHVFRLLFAAAALGLGTSLLWLITMEERPLRGRLPETVRPTEVH